VIVRVAMSRASLKKNSVPLVVTICASCCRLWMHGCSATAFYVYKICLVEADLAPKKKVWVVKTSGVLGCFPSGPSFDVDLHKPHQ
jgi:hypothetical protein